VIACTVAGTTGWFNTSEHSDLCLYGIIPVTGAEALQLLMFDQNLSIKPTKRCKPFYMVEVIRIELTAF